ncbi:MAG: head GIN domain-containing protein [Flavisolibacter sp.]
MKLIFTLFFSGIFTLVMAQKTINDPNVALRTVQGYHSIELTGGIDLYLSKGDDAVAVSAKDAETRDHIKTEVKDGVLKIYYDVKEGIKLGFNQKSLRAYVSCNTLKELSVIGGSNTIIDGTLKSADLTIKLIGGSDLTGAVDAEKLRIELIGGSDLEISGKAGWMEVQATGGCDMNGFGLVAEICEAKAIGGSDISITVNKEISAEAIGGSDVNWKGPASVKKSNATGAGKVSHRS